MNFTIKILATMLLVAAFNHNLYSQVPSPRPHPSYDYYNIQPPEWDQDDSREGYGGMAWLPDGRMVMAQYVHKGIGFINLLSNVLTARDGSEITVEKNVATGMYEPLGLEVVDGEIFMIEKRKLSKVSPNGNDWEYSVVYDGHDPWAATQYYHWFSMGLLYQNDKFYWALGSFAQYGNHDEELPERHGAVVEYDPATDSHRFVVHGLRNPGGIGLGPEGTICTNDNQGDWIPTSKFICIEDNAWYGYRGEDHPNAMGRPETPPTVWNTHQNPNKDIERTGYGRSPGEVIMVPKGIFKGQMLMTDVNLAWLSRLQLEKVDGSWQGANFKFGGGFRSGTWRMVWGPDSTTLIVGGIGGGGGGWAYIDSTSTAPNPGPKTFTSLHRLEFNGKETFELLAIRSMGVDQMEVEFTMPANSAAGTVSNYTVEQWQNITQTGYGAGHMSNFETLNVTAVDLSADGRKALLTIGGLKEASVVRISVNPSNVKSQSGEDFWYHFGDYTMNKFGPADPPAGIEANSVNKPGIQFSAVNRGKVIHLDIASPGNYSLTLTDVQGKTVRHVSDLVMGISEVPVTLSNGVYFLTLENNRYSMTRKISLF